MKPLISVIVVSYNTRQSTLKSLKSVQNSKGFKTGQIELILVDNHSTDDTLKFVKKEFPSVIIIANKENHGFGGGNNQGAAIARGKYLLLLNTDAYLSDDTLSSLVNIMEKEETVASVGPQLLFEDGSIQPSCGYLPTPLRILAWMLFLDKIPYIKKLFSKPYHIYDPSWYKKEQYPDWIMGACVMYRADEFTSIGGFDEKIFMYAEEVELYHRLKQTTKKDMIYTPSTSVVHVGSVSSKRANASRLAYELEGIEYFYAKHYPNLLWIIRTVIYTGVIMRMLLFSLMSSRRDVIIEYKQYLNRKK